MKIILALVLIGGGIALSFARPSDVDPKNNAESVQVADEADISLDSEKPEDVQEDVYDHKKPNSFNEDELPQTLARRQASSFNVQVPQEVKDLNSKLKEIKNGLKDKINDEQIEEMYSQMNPFEVKTIRSIALKLGHDLKDEDLVKIGRCKSESFKPDEVKTLIRTARIMYSKNKDRADSAGLDSSMKEIKENIFKQLDFVQKLSTIIEVQIRQSPQIDEAELHDLTEKIEKIKSRSEEIKAQLEGATDVSQLSNIGEGLLEIQSLSSKIQEKISAEVLEEKMKEINNSAAQVQSLASKGVKDASGSFNTQVIDSGNSNALQVRDVSNSNKPKFLVDIENFFRDIQQQPRPKIVQDFADFFKTVQTKFENSMSQATNDISSQVNSALDQVSTSSETKLQARDAPDVGESPPPSPRQKPKFIQDIEYFFKDIQNFPELMQEAKTFIRDEQKRVQNMFQRETLQGAPELKPKFVIEIENFLQGIQNSLARPRPQNQRPFNNQFEQYQPTNGQSQQTTIGQFNASPANVDSQSFVGTPNVQETSFQTVETSNVKPNELTSNEKVFGDVSNSEQSTVSGQSQSSLTSQDIPVSDSLNQEPTSSTVPTTS